MRVGPQTRGQGRDDTRPPLDRKALLRAFKRVESDHVRELDEILAEFDRLATAYVEARSRRDADSRRQRALHAQLIEAYRALCELRASMAAWVDAWALIDPASRPRMQVRGQWPLPEMPPLASAIALRAGRIGAVASKNVPSPVIPAGPARHLRLLPSLTSQSSSSSRSIPPAHSGSIA